MKVVSAFALAIVPCAAQPGVIAGSTLINDPMHIARLNAEPDSLWVAAPQNFFDGMTFDDARPLLGTRLSHISRHLNKTLPDSTYKLMASPDSFDSREQWPGLVHPIRDQQSCGSCWAFSASEVLGDRVAIASGKASPVLSPEDMVSCDKKDAGCQGGELENAWQYLISTGIVTDSCFPYKAGGGHAPKCVKKCVDSESFTRQKAQNSYTISGVDNMMKDIASNGPIQVGFKVYPSFMSYHKGIYHKHPHESAEGGHAVKIVGWGIAGKKKYWTVANSWNTNWGEDGFFRIARGRDECGIETMGPPYAGLPASAALDDIIVV